MRTLSAALTTAHGAAVQIPAWLVEIGFSTPLRISSYAAVSALGSSWVAYGVDVSRITAGAVSVGGELVLQNLDDAVGALVLAEGVSDRRIRIWGYDGAATADPDFVLLADCVGGAVEIDEQRARITLRDAQAFVASPRTFVTAAHGFTYLMPAGALIRLAGQTISLERE